MTFRDGRMDGVSGTDSVVLIERFRPERDGLTRRDFVNESPRDLVGDIPTVTVDTVLRDAEMFHVLVRLCVLRETDSVGERRSERVSVNTGGDLVNDGVAMRVSVRLGDKESVSMVGDSTMVKDVAVISGGLVMVVIVGVGVMNHGGVHGAHVSRYGFTEVRPPQDTLQFGYVPPSIAIANPWLPCGNTQLHWVR